jgi:serine/threonine protein kinase
VPAEAPIDSGDAFVGRLVLGRYRVVRPLARGGMGVVHLGRVEGAAGFAKPVVIKTVLANSSLMTEAAQLFVREARIVANLQHPNIVGVIDFGEANGSHVMVLEYVHGYNLGQWLRYVLETRGSMPVSHAVRVILGVLEALAYAHGLTRPDGTLAGIVHRDIAPGNVLIDLQGHLKITDFGIARSSDDAFHTQQGLFRGTVAYSAPEVLQGDPATPSCDQYACGVLLYQLLTGKHPFRSGETAQTITRILTHEPPSIATLRPDVPPEVDAAVMRAISKDPEQRFAKVEAFADALRAASDWSEREATLDFAVQIERDFSGDMAEHLGIEPLSLRDASWRQAQDDSGPQRVTLSSSPPGIRAEAGDEMLTQVSKTTALPMITHADSRTSGPARSRWLVPLALAIPGIVALLLVFVFRPQSEGPQQILVVERQAVGAETSLSVTEPTGAAPALPGSTTAAPRGSVATPASPDKPGTNRGSPLGRAFQRQEAKIQRCFQQHSALADDAPRVAVRFQVEPSGRVLSASVSPATVAGSPLGQCILEIARATDFGPQSESVSFSIPISARVVKR